MAQAVEAAAFAGGPTSHTQNQGDTLVPMPNLNTHGYTREEQIAALHKLREPFEPSEIRYLPRVWCKACRDAPGKVCNRPDHARRQCNKCGQSMTTAHIDLKFVGHAEATNRLLNVDPFWDWEPLATDASGLPQYDGNRGLWIRLTVCGMTRLGYGHADSKTGGDAVKEIIGDAIRNAGMRFGMALNLWTSSDLLILETGGEGAEDGADRGQERLQVPAQRAEQARPHPQQKPAQGQPQADAGGSLEEFRAKVHRTWNHLEAMRQNLLEARKFWPDTEVPVGEQQTPTSLVRLLEEQVDALAKRPAGQDRSAA
ncbi:MAG TPA: hypothetical protein VFY14_22705 [Streptomyces sp.]|nr:hypothetical protein [Streptomyces sp.]